MPFDAYTLYYVGQALYQVGGERGSRTIRMLRDYLIESQVRADESAERTARGAIMARAAAGASAASDGELYAHERGLLHSGDSEPVLADFAGREDRELPPIGGQQLAGILSPSLP